MKVAPSPGVPLLSTSIRPWWRSTIPLAIESPSPVPGTPLSKDARPRKIDSVNIRMVKMAVMIRSANAFDFCVWLCSHDHAAPDGGGIYSSDVGGELAVGCPY